MNILSQDSNEHITCLSGCNNYNRLEGVVDCLTCFCGGV